MAQDNRKDTEQRSTAESERKGQQGLEPRRQTGRGELAGRDPFAGFWGDPFGMVRRFNEEMDRWFSHAGFGRAFASPWWGSRQGGLSMWSPQVETFQRGDQFVVRVDLPGLKKEDINLEITDDAITIQGERHEEHEEDREGHYRSERSYGSFYRTIPLPEGAIAESAKATFKNGVLEVSIPAPPREVSRGRRIEISEGAGTERGEKKQSGA